MMLSTVPLLLLSVTLVRALPATNEPIYINLPVNQEIPTIASPSTDFVTTETARLTKGAEEEATSKPSVDGGDRVKVERTIGAGKPSLKFIQTFLAQVLQPKPLVDTIREEDKYGNDGEKLGQIGRSVVGGVEKLTNFISSAVNIPYEALKSLSRRATAALNNLGGKLVGIAV